MWSSATARTLGLTLVTVALVSASGLAAAIAADQTPSQVVDSLAGRVIPILRDNTLSSDQKRVQIEQIAYEAMDFEVLTKLVLARNLPKFSPEQRAQFTDEFKRHLTVTYGRNIDNYRNETQKLLAERTEARGDVTVQTKILRGGGIEDVLVDYRLRKSGGQWKIIDVIVEGISLVSNFRSQFQDIVANGGPDRLLVLLKEKNVKGETLAPPEEK